MEFTPPVATEDFFFYEKIKTISENFDTRTIELSCFKDSNVRVHNKASLLSYLVIQTLNS